MLKDYYRTEDIVEATGATRDTVYLWRDYGLLEMSQLSRSYGCTADELKRFLTWAEGKKLTNEDQIRFWSENKKLPSHE